MSDEIIKKIICESIRNYLRVRIYRCEDIESEYYLEEMWSDEFLEKYYNLAILLSIENYKSLNKITKGLNVSSINQGGQSISFSNNNLNNFITNEVKLLLPRPYIKGY